MSHYALHAEQIWLKESSYAVSRSSQNHSFKKKMRRKEQKCSKTIPTLYGLKIMHDIIWGSAKITSLISESMPHGSYIIKFSHSMPLFSQTNSIVYINVIQESWPFPLALFCSLSIALYHTSLLSSSAGLISSGQIFVLTQQYSSSTWISLFRTSWDYHCIDSTVPQGHIPVVAFL